jgi:serine/threonine protein kinase
MPAPATSEHFLELVRKSGIVDPNRLNAFLQQNPSLPEDPERLAALFVGEGLLTHFQRDQLLRGKWRGFTLGKYRVLERLGRGGMGAVYLCEHVVMGQQVAVKVLPEVRAENPASVARFYREARAAAALNHPNIIRAHDIDQEGKIHFLVMEYVDGVSLHDLVELSGPLPVLRASHYVHQTALGLHVMHQAGLIHRDVKPSNILVDRNGTVKILDLGLARFFTDHQDMLTREFDDQIIMGTADFLSPEQGRNSHDVDIRADVYSLGATFYFLLAGRAPFEGKTVTQKLLCHQLEEPTPLTTLRPDVPAELVALIARMMAKDPNQRYQSAAAIVEGLAPWTRTPIPPPSAEEMPRLSPAVARGQPVAPLAAPRTFPTVPGRETDGPEGPIMLAPVASLGPPSSTPTLLPPSENRGPSGLVTMEMNERAAFPGSNKGPGASRSRRRLGVGITVALVLVAVGVGLGLRWAFSSKTPAPNTDPPPAPPIEPPPIRLVEAASGKEVGFPTVAEALKKASPGDRIVVAKDLVEERLVLKGDGNPPKDVTLEGAAPSGKLVAWQPAVGQARGQSLLELSDVTGLRFKGFLLDGQGLVDDLVTLSGRCPGVTLEDVQLRGFCRSAVTLKECAGVPDRPVSLLRLRIFDGEENAMGLIFWAGPDKANCQVQVRDGRFEGPLQAAAQLAGSVAAVQFQGNRFFKLGDAFQYHKVEPGQQLFMMLASNTFCDVQTGLHFVHLPPAEQTKVTATNNLFAKTSKLAHIDDFKTQPAASAVKARWIWHDEPKPAAQEPRFFRKTFEVGAAAVSRATLEIVADVSFKAWVNGESVGRGDLNPQNRRVQALDVTRLLHKGKNVIAIQAVNRNRPADGAPLQGGLLAQLTYVPKGGGPSVTVATAAKTWLTAKQGPDGWQKVDFDDSKWTPSKALFEYGKGPGNWHNLLWDTLIEEQLPGVARPWLVTPRFNLRDRSSAEGFPLLETRVREFGLPAEPSTDAQFLRYLKTSPLAKLGQGGGPVGVPPVE